MIAPHQRIAASAVSVKSGAAGDKQVKILAMRVELPLQVIFPGPVFMDFIENDQIRRARDFPLQDLTAIFT